MTMVKILGSINTPSRQISLVNWGVIDSKVLCGQYEIEREIGE